MSIDESEYQATPISDEQYQAHAKKIIQQKEQPGLQTLPQFGFVVEPIRHPPMDFMSKLEAAISKQLGKRVVLTMHVGEAVEQANKTVVLDVTFDYKLYEPQAESALHLIDPVAAMRVINESTDHVNKEHTK